MTPEEIQHLADNLKVLAVLASAVGALVGALVGAPLLEWFKDRLGARRSWYSRRADIIATVRLVLARCDAFMELYRHATNVATRDADAAAAYRLSMANFDLDNLSDKIDRLSALDPSVSHRSGASQYLVQRMTRLVGSLAALRALVASQTTPSTVEGKLHDDVKENLSDTKVFVGTLYSDALGIKGSISVYDAEIAKHRFSVNRLKFETAFAERQRIAQEFLAKLEQRQDA